MATPRGSVAAGRQEGFCTARTRAPALGDGTELRPEAAVIRLEDLGH